MDSTNAALDTGASAEAVRPFRVEVSDEQIRDLHTRLANTRWPSGLPGRAWARGVEVSYLQGLANVWAHEFDWRAHEARINAHPQFLTEIEGQTVHFLHVTSPEPDATPLILLHGWPGSIVEFLELIGPLSDPRAHGGDPRQAFHLVIPSLIGFGFSSPLSGPGWTSLRMAKTFATLMARLGYTRYGAQGGDFGAFIAPDLGRVDPEHVIGVHVNAATVGFIPYGEVGDDERATMSEVELARLDRLGQFMTEGNGYFQIQASRPQTLSFGLADSPAGQLAWIVEKFKEWTDPDHELPEDAVSRDDLLANASLYWFTGTAGSSANLYYESMHSQEWPTPSAVPTAVAAFGQDVSIRRYGEQLNTITSWSDFSVGGHFAALETPDLLIGDVRRFFATVSSPTLQESAR